MVAKTILAGGFAAVAAVAGAAPPTSIPTTLTASYYTVTSSGTGDFQTQCCSVRPNLVAPTLDGSNLPVFTPDGGPALKDVTGTGEIQWWTPGVAAGGDVVAASGSALILTPYANNAMYPPAANGPSDANGYLTASYTGTFTLPILTRITANIGADDDAFVFVDGKLLAGLGGVHANVQAPLGSELLAGGTHTLNIFYADRYRTQASLNFDLTGTAVPEPASWALLLTGFGLLGFAARRRRLGMVNA